MFIQYFKKLGTLSFDVTFSVTAGHSGFDLCDVSFTYVEFTIATMLTLRLTLMENATKIPN